MNEWRLTVPGEPVPKGRARHSVRGGHVRTYTPAKTRSYEAEIRALAAEAWGARALLDGTPVTLEIAVHRGIPQSWSGKKQTAAACGQIKPMTRPDADNYCKACLDALNGVVFRDDSLVTDLFVSKAYSIKPGLHVTVRWDE